MDEALAHHQAGHVHKAKALYRRILTAHPSYPAALQGMGAIAYQADDHKEAVQYLSKACKIEPDSAELQNDLGTVLIDSGELDGAEICYRTALRVTDKRPFNYLHLGLIVLLFPKARIIHCRRDPMDVCLSIYFQYFKSRHAYAYDLRHIAHYYHEYERLMAHWRTLWPGRMLEVDYEALVADQGHISRRVIDYCGLEWDEGCLAFHKTERTVHTASNWQVRQPVYKTSVNRWKHYEKYLGPLKEALGDQEA